MGGSLAAAVEDVGVGVEVVDHLGLHQTVSKEKGTDRSGETSWSQGKGKAVQTSEQVQVVVGVATKKSTGSLFKIVYNFLKTKLLRNAITR